MESGFSQQQQLGFCTFSSKRSGPGPPKTLCMSGTTHGATWLQRTSVSTRYVSSLAWKYWDAFQVRGERQKLRAALFDLRDRELMDIGIARDEIDYIASQRSIDPRSG
jgi:uncharacterized protein YjiS (DUF1127 family)